MNEKYLEAKLQEAIYYAVDKHSGQKDKAGAPYIAHPIAVMAMASDIKERIVAVLHDIIEDTDATLADIRFMFGDEIAYAVDSVTKRKGETYFDFIRRAKNNLIGRKVKYYDLMHNLDRSRIKSPNAKDYDRWRKYEKAVDILTGLE